MFNSTVQVVAEQKNSGGAYIHIDTEYFCDPESMKNWLSGAVEWADRLRIFKVGASEFFFEGIVDKKIVPRWEKLRIEDHSIIDLFI